MSKSPRISCPVVSGFLGVGKTFYSKKYSVLELDQVSYLKPNGGTQNPDFPGCYIRNIKSNLNKDDIDIILVSSQEDVRRVMVEVGIFFILIYPYRHLKQEYLERYKKRGGGKLFIKFMDKNWDFYISSCESQKNCFPIIIDSGEYLENALLTLK